MNLPLARAAELIEASGAFNPESVAIGYSIDPCIP